MALQQIETVIQRLRTDTEFRAQYCQDPDGTLRAYLTPEEIRAIKTGDGHRLTELGCGEKWEELTATLCGPQSGPTD
jgi:hypothetical protein